jgi:hypothetical protein
MTRNANAKQEAMGQATPVPDVDLEGLREAIRSEYREVAKDPTRDFHFHTGRKLAGIVGYRDEWLDGVPERAIESFAGTGNPFRMGLPRQGERVAPGHVPQGLPGGSPWRTGGPMS